MPIAGAKKTILSLDRVDALKARHVRAKVHVVVMQFGKFRCYLSRHFPTQRLDHQFITHAVSVLLAGSWMPLTNNTKA
jgi:hypothetical protein